MKNKSSKDLSSELVKHGIATRNDNFYAWRCLMALGIDVDDGVVRTSMVHYNSLEDVESDLFANKEYSVSIDDSVIDELISNIK